MRSSGGGDYIGRMKVFLVALGAFALGALLTFLILGRYALQPVGNACLRVDRLTGRAMYWQADAARWQTVIENP